MSGVRLGMITYTDEELRQGYRLIRYGNREEQRPIPIDVLALYQLHCLRLELAEMRALMERQR